MSTLGIRFAAVLIVILTVVPFLSAQAADKNVTIVGSSITLPVRVTNTTPISVNMSTPATVTVSNTTPVPVTGNVAVTNTVPVSGTVNVNGTVPVEVSGTPTVNLGPNTAVKLDASTTLSIHDVDHPTRQPVFLHTHADSTPESTIQQDLWGGDIPRFAVPSGKMLVLDFVSAHFFIESPNETVTHAAVIDHISGYAQYLAVSAPVRSSLLGASFVNISQPLAFYAYPGDTLYLLVVRDGTSPLTIWFSATAHLVDCDPVAGCPTR